MASDLQHYSSVFLASLSVLAMGGGLVFGWWWNQTNTGAEVMQCCGLKNREKVKVARAALGPQVRCTLFATSDNDPTNACHPVLSTLFFCASIVLSPSYSLHRTLHHTLLCRTLFLSNFSRASLRTCSQPAFLAQRTQKSLQASLFRRVAVSTFLLTVQCSSSFESFSLSHRPCVHYQCVFFWFRLLKFTHVFFVIPKSCLFDGVSQLL